MAPEERTHELRSVLLHGWGGMPIPEFGPGPSRGYGNLLGTSGRAKRDAALTPELLAVRRGREW